MKTKEYLVGFLTSITMLLVLNSPVFLFLLNVNLSQSKKNVILILFLGVIISAYLAFLINSFVLGILYLLGTIMLCFSMWTNSLNGILPNRDIQNLLHEKIEK